MKNLSNETLHIEVLGAARAEKFATLRLLEFLHEVDRRQLHLERGYASLFSYTTQYLGYSDHQAFERVAAMRLAFKISEVKLALESGRLSLTTAAKLATHSRKRRLSADETLSLLPKIESKSKREVEKILEPDSPSPQLTIDTDEECLELMRRFKELNGDLSMTPTECFKHALKIAIRTKESKNIAKRKPFSKSTPPLASNAPLPPGEVRAAPRSRYVAIATRDAISKRSSGASAGSRCEFTDPTSGRRCHARHGLQFDHKIPFARGGPTNFENLQHLCSAHNQWKSDRLLN